MSDRRAVTSKQNGKLGGGQPGPRLKTRVRALAIQRHAELDAEAVIEQIARGALFDIGRLFYSEAGQELYDEDGPLVMNVAGLKPEGWPEDQPAPAQVPDWRKGDIKRKWNIGDLRPVHELTEEERTCIAGIEVVMKNATAGDGVIDRVLKLKIVDRSKYVEMAAKYHALFVEQLKITAEADLIDALMNGRQRAAERKKKG